VCVCGGGGIREMLFYFGVESNEHRERERERVECKNKIHARRREGFESRYYEGLGGAEMNNKWLKIP
jgi:hypothetical protein